MSILRAGELINFFVGAFFLLNFLMAFDFESGTDNVLWYAFMAVFAFCVSNRLFLYRLEESFREETTRKEME